MKKLNILLVLCIVSLLSCTKSVDIQEPERTDLTGIWNAYGYIDFSGYVPLEIIEITKTGTDYYTALKIMGDNGVPTGTVTWQGKLDGGINTVDFTLGSGNGNYKTVPVSLEIKTYDLMEIKAYGLIFVRRLDSNNP